MPNPKSRAYLNWSSGKDASLALYTLRQAGEVVVEKLLTAVNKEYDRVTMHGLPRRVLEAQAQAIGLPLETVALGATPSMEDYDRIMREKGQQLRAEGLEYSVFGDIFLEDLRQYREAQLRPLGLKPCFPLWKKDTRQLLLDFIALGFRAVVVCCNAQQLPRTFCGRPVDEQFLADLPAGVDPCGENGEFHTFCYDGPIFEYPLAFSPGEVVYRTYPAPASDDPEGPREYGFWYCDIQLAKPNHS